MTISATLSQDKVYVPEVPSVRPGRFAVRTAVTLPSLPKLSWPLVFGPLVPGLDQEQFVRVATVSDLNSFAYDPLVYFRDTAVDISVIAVPGSRLVISNPTLENILTAVPPVTEIVVAADSPNHRVQIANPAWYNTPVAMHWQLRDSTGITLLGQGVNGYYARLTLAGSLWLDSQFMALFGNSSDALDHIIAVQANFQSLLTNLDLSPTEYASPPNPIITAFTG